MAPNNAVFNQLPTSCQRLAIWNIPKWLYVILGLSWIVSSWFLAHREALMIVRRL